MQRAQQARVKPFLIPTGTRIGVILESGISTATAKPGDSVYFRTSFPITINNKVVVPVGSYLRGEVTESKRPGRVKGRGELRIRLNTMVFPNGYTVDMNAEPHSADGGQVKTDPEGKMTGPRWKREGRNDDCDDDGNWRGHRRNCRMAVRAPALARASAASPVLPPFCCPEVPKRNFPAVPRWIYSWNTIFTLDADQIHYSTVGQPNTVVIQQAPHPTE